MTEPTTPDEGAWFTVEDKSAVSAARRAAERLADQIGLTEQLATPHIRDDIAVVAVRRR